MARSDPAYKGQSDYTRPLLMAYDRVVVGFVSWFVWRCPSAHWLSVPTAHRRQTPRRRARNRVLHRHGQDWPRAAR